MLFYIKLFTHKTKQAYYHSNLCQLNYLVNIESYVATAKRIIPLPSLKTEKETLWNVAILNILFNHSWHSSHILSFDIFAMAEFWYVFWEVVCI